MTDEQRQTAHSIDQLTAQFLEIKHVVNLLEEATSLLRTSILVPMMQAVQELTQVAAGLRDDGAPQ